MLYLVLLWLALKRRVSHSSPISLLLYPFLHLSTFPLYKLPPPTQPVCLTCLQAQYKFPLLRCRSLNPRKMCGTSFMIIFNHFVLALMGFIISISVKCLFIRSRTHYSVLNSQFDSAIRAVLPSKRFRLKTKISISAGDASDHKSFFTQSENQLDWSLKSPMCVAFSTCIPFLLWHNVFTHSFRVIPHGKDLQISLKSLEKLTTHPGHISYHPACRSGSYNWPRRGWQ